MELPKILIADDAKINRHMLAVIFEGLYEIYEAADGQQTIDMLEKIENLDLLLLDINMPKKTGFDVLDYLREHNRMSELPVIIVTSSSEEEDELRAFEKGASEIVRKPFVSDVIIRRVKNLIELYSSRKQLQEKLVERTIELENTKKYDSLTGFLSRQEFFTSATNLLEHAGEQKYTVIYTNIRNFKYYNVKYGMNQGDTVLKTLAVMLQFDKAKLYGSIGQDHFVVIINEEQKQLRAKVDFIIEQFDQKFGKYGMLLKMGSYCFSKGNLPINVAVEYAKLACDVIHDKVDNYCEYNEELKRRLEIGTYVLQHIDEAIEKRYIQVYYQPVMRTINNKVCGMEALARWIDPVMGFLSPADFISTLEENHLISKLDFCILRQICENINTLNQEHRPTVPISFNLSRMDFQECDVLEEVERIVREAGIPRDFINIEVTETAFTDDTNKLLDDIRKLRELGYQVWMDDFGSGYSSLNVLKDYPFDEIKLDMIFLRSFDEKSKHIVTSIIDMAKKLGIQTLAEGVETKEQYDFLRSIGCEKVQGYYLSKPLAFEVVREFALTKKDYMEQRAWKRYYDQVGKVNFTADNSLALIEWDGMEFDYLYVNPRYEAVLQGMGMLNVEEAKICLNSKTSSLSRLFRKIMDGCQPGMEKREFIYTFGEQYVRSTMLCIAKQDKNMLLQTTILNG